MGGKIKPCPFCGGETYIDNDTNDIFVIVCDECYSEGTPCDTEAEAIEAWNKRTG